MNNIFNMTLNGAPTKKPREKDDFYPTRWEPTIALIRYYREIIGRGPVHEPACGDGAMSKLFIMNGIQTFSTDLIDRGFGTSEIDFLTMPADRYARGKFKIITNPPFKHWDEFAVKAHELEAPFIAFFAKQTIWNAKKRLKLYREHPPKAVHPLTWRVDFDGRGRPTMDCCWVVWGDEVPFSNEPFERPVHA